MLKNTGKFPSKRDQIVIENGGDGLERIERKNLIEPKNVHVHVLDFRLDFLARDINNLTKYKFCVNIIFITRNLRYFLLTQG